MTTNEIEEINRLERELRAKKEKVLSNQRNCTHVWAESKYDPEETLEQYSTGGYDGSGVDKWPKSSYRKVQKDRWSRTCIECGKVEYSYEQKAVRYEPYFGGQR